MFGTGCLNKGGTMTEKHSESRRAFLKTTTASAAGVAAGGIFPATVLARQGAWTQGMVINPAIDNLKVVSCKDPAMFSTIPVAFKTFGDIDKCVNAAVVHANMDEMAKALAKSAAMPNPSAAQAWATIFQRPEKHDFPQALVAIKVNANNTCVVPCTAIVNKLALELHNLGVPYANIIVYDGCTTAAGSAKYNYAGSPIRTDIKVSDGNSLLHTSDAANQQESAAVPAPYKTTGGTSPCTTDVAKGVVDILINVGTNKGNGALFGEVTLSMKNHYGTFTPVHEYNYLIGINKSDAILGGTPPRQQLAVIDSLTSVTVMDPTGAIDTADKWPRRLVMGTFSPAVDYITVKKVRQAEMGIKPLPNSLADDFLIQFGYTPQQRDAMTLIDVPPASTHASYAASRHEHSDAVSLQISGGSITSSTVTVEFPASEEIREVLIVNANGRLVRAIHASGGGSNSRVLIWDGITNTGEAAHSGRYEVLIRGERSQRSGSFILKR
jgi:hypothetical protein